jgi:hypothetical protein
LQWDNISAFQNIVRFIIHYYLIIVMAITEIVYGGIKGILTDGYFPAFNYFKKTDWIAAARKEKLPSSEEIQRDFHQNIYRRYLTPGAKGPNVRQLSNFYRKMEKMLESDFCSTGSYKTPCVKFQFPAVGEHNMKKMLPKGWCGKKELQKKTVPVILKEIEHDLSQGKNTLVFHHTYQDLNSGKYCPNDECARNWMEFMGFEIKKEEDYIDFESFKDAVEIYLKRDIEWELEHGNWFER